MTLKTGGREKSDTEKESKVFMRLVTRRNKSMTLTASRAEASGKDREIFLHPIQCCLMVERKLRNYLGGKTLKE